MGKQGDTAFVGGEVSMLPPFGLYSGGVWESSSVSWYVDENAVIPKEMVVNSSSKQQVIGDVGTDDFSQKLGDVTKTIWPCIYYIGDVYPPSLTIILPHHHTTEMPVSILPSRY